MKPEMPVQGLGFEGPLNVSERIIAPTAPEVSPETSLNNSVEKFEKRSEVGAITSDISLATSLPMPFTQTITISENAAINDFPIVANDDELIEKEWVDRAKRIVSDTRDDPHRRDEEVNKLQADYVKKRYGRELGAA